MASAAADFIEAVEKEWPRDPAFGDIFLHVALDGERIGAVCLDESEDDDVVVVNLIAVRRGLEGKGYGSLILDRLCEMADAKNMDLRLCVVPGGRLVEQDLVDWYARRGFEREPPAPPFDEWPVMSRSPRPMPAATPS
jgi:GNAT superfamily N-acetyltransferase